MCPGPYGMRMGCAGLLAHMPGGYAVNMKQSACMQNFVGHTCVVLLQLLTQLASRRCPRKLVLNAWCHQHQALLDAWCPAGTGHRPVRWATVCKAETFDANL
jgi:hypothetical protein